MSEILLQEGKDILVCRSGFTSDGRQMTDEMFEEAVETFGHRGYYPGFILGHAYWYEEDKEPRYGDIGSINYDKETGEFTVNPSYVSMELSKMIKDHQYPYMSIELGVIHFGAKTEIIDGQAVEIDIWKWRLDNVALLGKLPPAVPEARTVLSINGGNTKGEILKLQNGKETNYLLPTEINNSYLVAHKDKDGKDKIIKAIKLVNIQDIQNKVNEKINLINLNFDKGDDNMSDNVQSSETTAQDVAETQGSTDPKNYANSHEDSVEKELSKLKIKYNQINRDLLDEREKAESFQQEANSLNNKFKTLKRKHDEYVFINEVTSLIVNGALTKKELGLNNEYETDPMLTDSELFNKYCSMTDREKDNFFYNLSLRTNGKFVKSNVNIPLGTSALQEASNGDLNNEHYYLTQKMNLAKELAAKAGVQWLVTTQKQFLDQAENMMKMKRRNV